MLGGRGGQAWEAPGVLTGPRPLPSLPDAVLPRAQDDRRLQARLVRGPRGLVCLPLLSREQVGRARCRVRLDWRVGRSGRERLPQSQAGPLRGASSIPQRPPCPCGRMSARDGVCLNGDFLGFSCSVGCPCPGHQVGQILKLTLLEGTLGSFWWEEAFVAWCAQQGGKVWGWCRWGEQPEHKSGADAWAARSVCPMAGAGLRAVGHEWKAMSARARRVPFLLWL